MAIQFEKAYLGGVGAGFLWVGTGVGAGGTALGFGIFRNAGAPTNGTAGTLNGDAEPGSLLVDTTNAKLYINTNTKASPTWTVVGAQTA